jgi:hypothetical protein
MSSDFLAGWSLQVPVPQCPYPYHQPYGNIFVGVEWFRPKLRAEPSIL